MATTEAPIHDNVKQQIVDNDERSTVLVFRKFHNTARVVRNSISERIVEISEREGATFDDIAELASGMRGRKNVLTEGSMEDGMWWAGQTQGLIHDVDSVQGVIDRVIADAEEIIGRLPTLVR
jgi:nitronate monooxygenase